MISEDRAHPAPDKQSSRDNQSGFQIDLTVTIVLQNSGKAHRGKQDRKARTDGGMLRESSQIDEGGNDEHASADTEQTGGDSSGESNEQQKNR